MYTSFLFYTNFLIIIQLVKYYDKQFSNLVRVAIADE
jgi:hypothetical protein